MPSGHDVVTCKIFAVLSEAGSFFEATGGNTSLIYINDFSSSSVFLKFTFVRWDLTSAPLSVTLTVHLNGLVTGGVL